MKAVLTVAACMALAVTAQAKTGRQTQTFQTADGPVEITPIYHACAQIEAGGKIIYIDPARPAPIAGLPPGDLILITHNHSDHMDPVDIAKLSKPGTEIVGPALVAKTVTQTHVISNGQSMTWGKWMIQAVPAYNIVHKRPNGVPYHPKGVGNGYVLTYGGKKFYFSGDTEFIPAMRNLKNIDVAFICMNLPYTMTPAEAAQAIKAIHPRVAIPYHYRANPPTDLSVFKKDLAGTGIQVRLLNWYPKTS